MKLSFIRNLIEICSNDPVRSCLVYKRHGCAHVDGMLCDFLNCNILENYKLRELEQQLDIPLKDRIDPNLLENKNNE